MLTRRDRELLDIYGNVMNIPITQLAGASVHLLEYALQQGYDPNKHDKKFGGLIHGVNFSLTKIQILLKYGADINMRSLADEGNTILMEGLKEVVFHHNYMEYMEFLIDNGADVWIKDDNGDDVFMFIERCTQDPEYNLCYCDLPNEDDYGRCSNCVMLKRHQKQLTILKNHVNRKQTFFELMLPKLLGNNKKQRF